MATLLCPLYPVKLIRGTAVKGKTICVGRWQVPRFRLMSSVYRKGGLQVRYPRIFVEVLR